MNFMIRSIHRQCWRDAATLLLSLTAAGLCYGHVSDRHVVPLMAASADPLHQGFVRVVNRSDQSGEVVIEAIDDAGTSYGPLPLALAVGQTQHFNSDDLEQGNPNKGLAHGTGPGEGQWRLELRSDLDIDVLTYVRNRSDGYLTSMHDLAAADAEGHYYVAFFNPGSNDRQVSRLRLTNPGSEAAQVEMDDRGASPGDTVALTLGPLASRTLTSMDLESGTTGVSGTIGDGSGKWRLRVRSESPLQVMSLLQSPTGHLANLSTVPQPLVDGDLKTYRVLWFKGGSRSQGGFLRVINHSAREGMVEVQVAQPAVLGSASVHAVGNQHGDYDGLKTMELTIDANSVVHLNYVDLTEGNADKGLPVGAGESFAPVLAHLQLRSDLNIEVLSYQRTGEGFVTSMHDLVPQAQGVHHVAITNPGSNFRQQSVLALFNPREDDEVHVKITAADDRGGSPGSAYESYIDSYEVLVLSAQDLEHGSRNLSWASSPSDYFSTVSGALGDGSGKWRLRIQSAAPIQVMSLMLTPSGHITNLSSAPDVAIAGIDSLLPANANAPLPGGAAVSIPDEGLLRVVEAALGKARGAAISTVEMATLTRLDIPSGEALGFWPEGQQSWVEDLTGLEAAVNLEELHLGSAGSDVADLTPLSGLTSLRVLDLESVQSDLSLLTELRNLKVLDLTDGIVRNFEALGEIESLEVLKITFTDPEDLSWLGNLLELRVFDFRSSTSQSVLDTIPDMPSLVELNIIRSADYGFLGGMPNLRVLRLEGAHHAEHFQELVYALPGTSLRVLEVGNKTKGWGWAPTPPCEPDVAYLSPLSPMPSALSDLRVLHLGDVCGDLTPLSKLPALVELGLTGGLVEDISALSGLTRLQKVYLSDNRITDLAPLVANPGLGVGDFVDVSSNPLAAGEYEEHLESLFGRGVLVVWRPTVE